MAVEGRLHVYARTGFEALLKANHLGPEDIDYVVMSHLHSDHSGNLRVFNSAPTQIITDEREYAYAKSLTVDDRFYLRMDFDVPSSKFVTINGDDELAAGVWIIRIPGHTEGTIGLMVDTANAGTLIFTSDACYLKESYERERSEDWVTNDSNWASSMRKIKSLAQQQHATVVFGHDHETCHGEGCPIDHEGHVRTDRPYD